METRKEIAAEKKRCGAHNCTQAVVCTYHDYTGMDEATLKHIGNAFAAGMGNMEGLHCPCRKNPQQCLCQFLLLLQRPQAPYEDLH